jgi:hypothetical protein
MNDNNKFQLFLSLLEIFDELRFPLFNYETREMYLIYGESAIRVCMRELQSLSERGDSGTDEKLNDDIYSDYEQQQQKKTHKRLDNI